MSRFYQQYLTYRGVGFAPVAALRFAWLVAVSGATPITLRRNRRA